METLFLKDSKFGAAEECSTDGGSAICPSLSLRRCAEYLSKWRSLQGCLFSERPGQKDRQGPPRKGSIWALFSPTSGLTKWQENRLTGAVRDDHASPRRTPAAQSSEGAASMERCLVSTSLIFYFIRSVRGCGVHREPSSAWPSNFLRGTPRCPCCHGQ